MKRWNLWYLASGIVQVACVVHILLEWRRYSEALNSAPFSVTILVNGVCFGIPAAILFLIGLFLEIKRKDDSHEHGC